MSRLLRSILPATALLALALTVTPAAAAVTCTPVDSLGDFRWERSGTHDAANIRTVFWNFGMVGDYPSNPEGVDLSTFHSAEVPKGSGMNYTDGITPFVIAHVVRPPVDTYVMETGYRERQAPSITHGVHDMRFEPRRGYFQEDPLINVALSPAISNDARTWPATWPDKAGDTADPGWRGSWNGYFGKRPAADQESFSIMDDQYYEAFPFDADSTCPGRKGLGLRVDVRGFQWSNPQATNVIFWHYDITNESTTDYDNDIVFGLYMDSGVGGSAKSCDGVAESDDDNAFFDKSLGLNLVYTWDKYGHGADLSSNCDGTGYLGYAYLETPGDPYDGIDNDDDGITDESRSAGPGTRILGQDAILAYVAAHDDTLKFTTIYGPITKRPAYVAGVWWTGDEDMDWIAEFDDTGADGVFGSANPAADGERDGIPTEGEPHFDRTDVDESDQIGLTGFKYNRINGPGAENVVFYHDARADWPQVLYSQFTNPDSARRYDPADLVATTAANIAFLFASGPFRLPPQEHERFSLALAFGATLGELRENVHVVQLIYNANYQFAVPPPRPTLHAETGDRYVRLSWDDVAEHAFDPVSNLNDFEGYRIYRSTDPEFRDPRTLTTGQGTPLGTNGVPIKQFDLADQVRGYSHTSVSGVKYWLGEDTGITHTWTDTTAVNGQQYFYAICAYDYGSPPGISDSLAFYPSENSIPVSRTLRGGLLLPINVIIARPEPRPPGFVTAATTDVVRLSGKDDGSVQVRVVQADSVVAGHVYKVTFLADSANIIHAESYALIDSTTNDTLFTTGADFDGRGVGPTGAGLLPVVTTPPRVLVDTAHTGFRPGARTTLKLDMIYESDTSPNIRRPGYPTDLRIVFADSVIAHSVGSFRLIPFTQPRPVKFNVYARTDTGWRAVPFVFADASDHGQAPDSTLSDVGDLMHVLDFAQASPAKIDYTYLFSVRDSAIVRPAAGDTFDLHLTVPLGPLDAFTFKVQGPAIDAAAARAGFAEAPYVVPNPYIGAASFEPAPFAVSGRGDRRLEFRNIPVGAVVRIYTVHGDLVQTLRQDGAFAGYVPWNLRTKDNLDVAPGLYVFHVSAPGVGEHVGKFAIVK